MSLNSRFGGFYDTVDAEDQPLDGDSVAVYSESDLEWVQPARIAPVKDLETNMVEWSNVAVRPGGCGIIGFITAQASCSHLSCGGRPIPSISIGARLIEKGMDHGEAAHAS